MFVNTMAGTDVDYDDVYDQNEGDDDIGDRVTHL